MYKVYIFDWFGGVVSTNVLFTGFKEIVDFISYSFGRSYHVAEIVLDVFNSDDSYSFSNLEELQRFFDSVGEE